MILEDGTGLDGVDEKRGYIRVPVWSFVVEMNMTVHMLQRTPSPANLVVEYVTISHK